MRYHLLIFTDLDGTLLDHRTYSYQGAAETLQRLHRLSVPLILTSSKTRWEITRLQERLGLNEPFISENGGGIFVPPEYPIPGREAFKLYDGWRGVIFGKPYRDIRKIFVRFRDEFALKGFGDMSIEEIMAATGLGREESVLAARREFTEPFLMRNKSRADELRRRLTGHGFTLTRGGRFYHLMAAGQDKGRAVRETVILFRGAYREKLITAGLGDARNDYDLLQAVDIPVLIPLPDGSYEEMEIEDLRKAPFPGSRGWGIMVADILEEVARRQ